MASTTVLGFVGLGVMGEPMCKNLAAKSGARVVAFDARPAPLDTLAAHGVERAASVADVAARADIVFVCLPGEPEVRAVCLGAGGVMGRLDAGRTLVDMSTVPVALARELGAAARARGVSFADAPVARTVTVTTALPRLRRARAAARRTRGDRRTASARTRPAVNAAVTARRA